MSDTGRNGGGASREDEERSAGETGTQGAGTGRAWGVNTERLRVTGAELWTRLRQLIHEGNVRRIIVRDRDERVLLDIPVTVGVAGVVLAPFAVAIAAVAALAVRCTIEVERVQEKPAADEEAAEESAEAESDAGAEAT